jgi:hypothetical protein
VGLSVDALLPRTLQPRIIGDLLVGTATLVGGFLAAAFALSVTLQQTVAELYSPQNLAGYSYGTRQRLIYFALALSVLACLGFGLYCLSLDSFNNMFIRRTAVAIGFGLLGLGLALVEAQLMHGSQRLRPSAATDFIREEAIRTVERLDREARRLSRAILLQQPGLSTAKAVALAYQSLNTTISQRVVHQLTRLHEMILRLSDGGESVAAGHALESWATVLVKYLEKRRDCSIVMPSSSHFLAVESDSQWIINRALEQLNDIGQRFLKNSQVPNGRAVARVYQQLGDAAARVSFVGDQGDNPILDQLGWYLGMYGRTASSANDLDVPFAVAEALTSLGVKSIEIRLAYAPAGTCKQLESLVSANARFDRLIVIQQCVRGFIQLLWLILVTNDAPTHFNQVFESLERTHETLKVLRAASQATGPMDQAWSASRSVFELLQNMLHSYQGTLGNLSEVEKASARSRFDKFADGLYSFLRRNAESATSQSPYTDLLPLLMLDVVSVYVPFFLDPYGTAVDEISHWVYLPTWVASKEKPFKESRPVLDAIHAAARMALLFLRVKAPEELVRAAIDAQGSLVGRMNEHHLPSYGYDEPRAMIPLVLVAAAALKQEDLLTLAAAANAIHAGELGYAEKFAAVKAPSSVILEALKTREKLLHMDVTISFVNPLLAEARRQVPVEDFDRVVFYLWGAIPKESPVRSELLERKRLYSRLVGVLHEHANPSHSEKDASGVVTE